MIMNHAVIFHGVQVASHFLYALSNYQLQTDCRKLVAQG